MISIIITAYKEERTIEKAITAFLKQKNMGRYEIIVTCPDSGTRNIVKKLQKKYKKIRLVKDPEKGKPVALNNVFDKAKGSIIVLSDGDVFVEENSIQYLLEPFKNKKIGAVTGRPVSINSKREMLGFWSHLLTDLGAHETRKKLAKQGEFLVCSGYLYAMRAGIVKHIHPETLSDDAVVTSMVAEKGYRIGYAPRARVYIKYPTTFEDWIIQKKRSAGGYLQLKEFAKSEITMRTFKKEAGAVLQVFTYSRNLQEFFWTVLLIFARLYLWWKIFWDIKVKREGLKKTWKRVETTK